MKVFGMIVAGFIGLFAVWGISTYNGLVSLDQNVNQTYAQVQVQLRRQAQLLPNLANAASAYMDSESDTMKSIASARSQMGAVGKLDPTAIANDANLQKQVIQAQSAMSSAMVKLNAATENYPQLKASGLIEKAMIEMSTSQNKISQEMRKNQLAVQAYNVTVKRFPTVIIASMTGNVPKPFFVANETEQNAPELFKKK